MFRQEMFGYSKEDVDTYLKKTLERLEKLEKVINHQKEQITKLETKLQNSDTSDNEELIEQAKRNADEIIFSALEDMNDLDDRIHRAILKELEK